MSNNIIDKVGITYIVIFSWNSYRIWTFTIDIAADTSIQVPNSEPLNDPATPIVDFQEVKNVRFYIPGPVNDGVSYVTPMIQDSLCIIGYPKMKLFASSTVDGGGPTDTDYFVRIVDIYPDGREFYVSEGAINGRARDYAKSIYNGQANDESIYSNLESGVLYELEFKMMPIAYTFGHQHRMKILVSSSNYPRYQSNPNLPVQEGEFFRRDVLDGQVYEYNGVEMSPRIAEQHIYADPGHPSQIILPVFGELGVGEKDKFKFSQQFIIYPNPAHDQIFIRNTQFQTFSVNIYNISGQLIHQEKVVSSIGMLELFAIESGIYLIEMISADGARETHKLIIEP